MADRLRQLRIEPVTFPDTPGDSFAQLRIFLERWAVRSTMGYLEHRARLEGLLQAPPPVNPDDQDYIREALTLPDRAAEVAAIPPHAEWLDWALENEVLNPLFKVVGGLSESEAWIAVWIADNFVTQRPGRVQDILRQSGSVFAPHTWAAILRRLTIANPPPPSDVLGRWVDLLIADVPPQAHETIGHLARRLNWNEHRAIILLLFAELTRPVAVVSANLLGREPTLGISTKGDSHSIRDIWERHLQPNLNEIQQWLADLVTGQIETADFLLEAAGESTREHDFLSYRIPEI